MRSPLPLAAFAALALSALSSARPAHAEPSAWFSGGGGVAFQRNAALGGALETRPAMSLAFGVGTTPAARATLGLGLRMTTFFAQGTDLAIAPRLSTGGFARGDFGLAVELGVALRGYKGGDYGRVPLQVVALFGAPFGLQVGLGAQSPGLDGGASGGFLALFEIDLLRLSVLRQGSSTRFWENPLPLGGAVRELPAEPAPPPPPPRK